MVLALINLMLLFGFRLVQLGALSNNLILNHLPRNHLLNFKLYNNDNYDNIIDHS